MKSMKVALMVGIGALLLLSAFAQPAMATTRSQNIAMVPSAGGKFNMGGELPTTGIVGAPGVPSGYAPVFTNVSPDDIANGTLPDPIGTGFDTVVLVGLCDIGTYLSDTDFKTRIENFASAGGKLVIWDSECTSTDYSNFAYPFTTNNPGAAGATGTLTDVEENTLSSTNSSDPSYVNDSAVSSGTDAVGDANVFVTFNQNWCTDLKATNVNGVNGPGQTYAPLGSGLIIYSGLDKDFMTNSSPSFDPASSSGQVHLQRIWLLQLLQPFNPDGLPCGVKVFGLSLSPKTASNSTGTPHTVTAHVTTNAAPSPGVTVTFTITSGPNTGQTGTDTTDSNGDATFTYTSTLVGTDTIKAEATLTGQGGQQVTVSDTAQKTWTSVTPPTPCTIKITNGGWIVTDDADRASFGGVAKETSTGIDSGSEEFQDHGPADPMNVHSLLITDIICDNTGTKASIFGTATVDGTGSHVFQIDVEDNGEPGKGVDHYRMRIPDIAYDSGDQILRGGNVQIH